MRNSGPFYTRAHVFDVIYVYYTYNRQKRNITMNEGKETDYEERMNQKRLTTRTHASYRSVTDIPVALHEHNIKVIICSAHETATVNTVR